MTYYIKKDSRINVYKKESMDIREKIPAGTYRVCFDSMAGQFFLDKMDNFTLPSKIYGNTLSRAGRIIKTFESRKGSTGVLLTGEKGSGKSLLAKNVCMQLLKGGVPTLVVNDPWCGDGFNSFIASIEEPVIVLFDEFEKTYNSDDQESMLTLLDGVYQGQRLFLLTANNKYAIDRNMTNRPGRLFYMLEYDGLDDSAIKEYCEDRLDNKEEVTSILRLGKMCGKFNFDMLQSLVEEMNRYDEVAKDALGMLNIDMDGTQMSYEYSIKERGKKYNVGSWKGNIMETFDIYARWKYTSGDTKGQAGSDYIYLHPEDITAIDPDRGLFVFKKDKATITFKQQPYIPRRKVNGWL